jgi:hypothetical protein
MLDFLKIFQELVRFLIGRPIVGSLLLAPLVLFFAILVMLDYFCMDPEPIYWALAASLPLSGTFIRMLDHEATRFLVGERWSLPIFMVFSLVVNGMIAGAITLPYWLFRVLINPVCQ